MARQAQKDFDKNGKLRGWKIKYRYKDYTGKIKDSTKSGFKHKRDAEEWLNNFLESKSGGNSMKLENFVPLYLENVDGRMKQNTMIFKKFVLEKMVIPYLGNKPMNEISAIDIRNWQNEMINRGYKPTYLKMINAQLAVMFNFATRFYDLKSNPCIKAGTIGSLKTDEMKIWTKSEFEKFADEIKADKNYWVAFTLLYWTGLRIGELFALTPEDFNFEKNELSVSKSYQRIKRKDVISDPKTPKSKRIITIPNFVSEIMEEYINSIYGITKKSRIFTMSKSSLNRKLDLGVKKSGVKRIRIHDFRHSHASLLIEKGFNPVVIADRLGHEKVTTTLNTYSHIFPNKQKELANVLDELNKKD